MNSAVKSEAVVNGLEIVYARIAFLWMYRP